MGRIRADYIGDPDLSANVAATLCSQVAQLYHAEPQVKHEQSGAAERMQTLLRDAGWTSVMQRVMRDTIGLREHLVRPHVVTDQGQLRLEVRSVPPDVVVARQSEVAPSRPSRVAELRRLKVANEVQWVWEVWDSVAGTLHYSKSDEDGAAPIPGATVVAAEAYPFVAVDGEKLLPYVVYHAARSTRLWDYKFAAELFDVTLTAAVFYTHAGHAFRHASWPQRYIINGKVRSVDTLPDGGENAPPGGRREAIADPTVVLEIVPYDDGEGNQTQVSAGQWTSGGDPEMLLRACARYEERAATFVGLSPSDLSRTSGDPRSGYALAVSRSAQREASSHYLPLFAPVDQAFLRLVAVQFNTAAKAAGISERLPETGWTLQYAPLPQSSSERAAEVAEVTDLLERRLISRVDAYARLHGVTKDQAIAQLATIDQEATAA